MTQADTVGSIDSGILAATWSPDESLLTLITGRCQRVQPMQALTEVLGDQKLMLMTSTFDVLSEAALYTEEYGEGNDKPHIPRLRVIPDTSSLRRADQRRLGFQADPIPRFTRQGGSPSHG